LAEGRVVKRREREREKRVVSPAREHASYDCS